MSVLPREYVGVNALHDLVYTGVLFGRCTINDLEGKSEGCCSNNSAGLCLVLLL